jgi:hypothetical protein
MSEMFFVIALLGTIIGGGIGVILCWKSDNFALIVIPMIIGVCAITIPSIVVLDSERNAETKAILTDFDKLNCSDKADLILKNYLDGNTSRTSDLIPAFVKADCKFNLTTQLVLEGSK